MNGREAATFDGKVHGRIDRMLPAHVDAECDEIDDAYHAKCDDGDEEEMIASTTLQHAKNMVKYLTTTTHHTDPIRKPLRPANQTVPLLLSAHHLTSADQFM